MSWKAAKRIGIFTLTVLICLSVFQAAAYAEGENSAGDDRNLDGGALTNGTVTGTAGEGLEDEEAMQDETPEEIPDDAAPLALMPGWALLNLFAMILTVCISAGMIITFSERNGGADRENDGTGRELTAGKKTEDGRRKSKFFGLIPGLGSLATFFLTEDMSANMELADRWTALMLAMLAIDAALAWLTRNEKPEEEPEEV